jgi:hypothetical protein
MTAPPDPRASPLPLQDWDDREIPKYRASKNLEPPQHRYLRVAPPRATLSAGDVWQFGLRAIKANEIFETKFWPHESFEPVNESARRVKLFFSSRPKSVLPWRPWSREGRVVLNDGLTRSMRQKISIPNNGDTAA